MFERSDRMVSPDKEREPQILLRFFRHGDKGKGADDLKIRLTEQGRAQAIDASEPLENAVLAKAWGSPRERAQETAVLKMDGVDWSLTPNVPTEDLDALAGRGVLGAKRVEESDLLNFVLDESAPTGEKAMAEFKAGRYLKWLVEESDADARENGDADKTWTYSRYAGNIATAIYKYANALNRWEGIVQSEERDSEGPRKFPKEYADTLERFLGSHQGVTECFLAKVIEKTEGAERRDNFVEVLDNKGFGFVEGFSARIIRRGDAPVVAVSYRKEGKEGQGGFVFEREVGMEVIEEIIAEGTVEK